MSLVDTDCRSCRVLEMENERLRKELQMEKAVSAKLDAYISQKNAYIEKLEAGQVRKTSKAAKPTKPAGTSTVFRGEHIPDTLWSKLHAKGERRERGNDSDEDVW